MNENIDLSSYSIEEQENLIMTMRKLNVIKNNNPLRFSYHPSPKQEFFHKDSNKRRLIRAGNQVGKTHAAAAEAWWYAMGEHPYKDVPSGPTKGLIISADWSGYKDVIAKVMWDLAPKHLLADRTYFTDGIGWNRNLIKLKNGSVIYFRSCESKATAIAGLSVDWVWIDEPPVESLWGEITSRAAVNSAPIFMSFTPVGRPVRWLKNLVEGDKTKGIAPRGDWSQTVIHVSEADCPHRTKESIDLQLSSYTRSEYNQRVYGAWEGIATDRTIEGFTDSNVSQSIPLNKWRVALAIDYGEGAGRTVALLVLFDTSKNSIYILDEYISKTITTPEDDWSKIRSILKFHGLDASSVEYGVGDVNSAGKSMAGTTVNRMMESISGIKFRKAKKGPSSVEKGIRLLNIAFMRSHISVSPNCEFLVESLKVWKNDKATEKNKDPIDALRYVCVSILEKMYTSSELDRINYTRI